MDLVIDLIGGAVFDRSLGVLRPGGVIVSAVEFAAETKAKATGRRGFFHRVQADAGLMEMLAQDVARGELRSTIAEVCGPDQLHTVIERAGTVHAPGKSVVRFAARRDDQPQTIKQSSHLSDGVVATSTEKPS